MKQEWIEKAKAAKSAEERELSDDELDNVSGGGCNGSDTEGLAPAKPQYYAGQIVYLCNSGHTFGSKCCQNPVCGSQVFSIVKQIGDTDTFLLECMGCDWTYHAVKDNIACT